MNYNMEYNNLSLKDRIINIWYKYNKYIILSVCVIFIFVALLLIFGKSKPANDGKYKDIERIMIINAQNYIKNNNIKDNYYVSLNNLNVKIDGNLKCNNLSGVYREKENYYPYLVCENYKSKAINDIIEENKNSEKYALLSGDNPYIIDSGDYIEQGVKNNNNYRINIKNKDVGDGLNIVKYSITDKGKYVGELKRIVIAEDLIGSYPVLTLIGSKTRTIAKGSTYKETGYDAIDEKDGNITDKVKVSGNVNTNVAGTYKLTYSVTNSRGKTVQDKRTIIVNENENIDLKVSHKIVPETVVEKSVTIVLTVSGNGYKSMTLPDNSSKTDKEVSYTVYKNGTYDFLIYDTNNNSEVYSVTVKNIDDGIKGICTGEYENGYGLAKLSFKLTGGSPQTYKFLSDGKVLQSGKGTTYQATNNLTLLINPKVVVTNIYGRDTTITCSVKHQNYITYEQKGYYFKKGASSASKSDGVINPYPNNGIAYYLHVPEGVTKDDKLPLIMGLHGGFGFGLPCGKKQETTTEANQTYHYYKRVFYANNAPINNVMNPDVRAVIITPSNMTCGWEDSAPKAIDILYAYIKLYNIDFDNIVVTGISQGGYGTLYTGFLEEHVFHIASGVTSLSSIAALYNTTVDEIVSYNQKIKTDIKYSDNKKDSVRSGSLTIIRPKTKNDQRSLFSVLIPMSPAKNDSRCSFTPTTIYDNKGKKCPSTPPYSIKTPIWLISSNDEVDNIIMFSKELTAYYSKHGDIRYTVLTKLQRPHDTDRPILGSTTANDWILKQKYGHVKVSDNKELEQIESQLGSNFWGNWLP